MVCLCGLTSPKNFDKESARRSIGQSDTFNMRRACGLIRQDPRQGASDIISAPQAARGNCRRHDPHIGIMIHPYDTATHKNERGASPVELPSRPFCLPYSTFLKNNKIYSAFLLKICYDRRQDIEVSLSGLGKEGYDNRNQKRFNCSGLWDFFCG